MNKKIRKIQTAIRDLEKSLESLKKQTNALTDLQAISSAVVNLHMAHLDLERV